MAPKGAGGGRGPRRAGQVGASLGLNIRGPRRAVQVCASLGLNKVLSYFSLGLGKGVAVKKLKKVFPPL